MVYNGLDDAKNSLLVLYEQFESVTDEFKKTAACKIGCATCCINVGNVDITTLEGMIIRDRISQFDRSVRREIRKKLDRNMAEREKGNLARCAFLHGENTCLIYDIRPFSCRRVYSIEPCDGGQPVIHRNVMELAKFTIHKLQQLDRIGYSGHMSYILALLEKTDFARDYEIGKFAPEKIMSFGKIHGIMINQFATEKFLLESNSGSGH